MAINLKFIQNVLKKHMQNMLKTLKDVKREGILQIII